MQTPGLPTATARAAAEILGLLADETRLKVMWVLMQGEISVGALAERVGAKPAAVSQHLAKLRLAGMATVRREGTFAYYRSCDEHIDRIVSDIVAHTSEELAAAGQLPASATGVPSRPPTEPSPADPAPEPGRSGTPTAV